jgi:integrase/recombinase XerD
MPQLPKTVPPALSVEDARALLDACETERDKAIVLFLLDTGLRAAELIALDGADVDLLAVWRMCGWA